MADESAMTPPARRRDRRRRSGYTLVVGFDAPAEESSAVVTKVLGALQGVEVNGIQLDRAPDQAPAEG